MMAQSAGAVWVTPDWDVVMDRNSEAVLSVAATVCVLCRCVCELDGDSVVTVLETETVGRDDCV